MAKKKSDSKVAAKLQKKAKQETKAAKNELKAVKGKGKSNEDDLEAILAQFQEDWKAAHQVTEEIQGAAPSRRVNASFTACGDYLWLIGGEYFDGGRATFYNDIFRYSPDKDEWRLYTSATAPLPRSAHAVVAVPKEGGQLWLFGGEYASPNQTSFHHYRDLWVFSIKDHAWEKVETRAGPTARSGHRMALWKNYLVLYGGFHDIGIRTNYLSDLWLFDMETYKWKQIEMRDVDRAPSGRSGFSMLPCAEGVLVHGGYRKDYVKGTQPKGVALEDTWLLHMDADPAKLKWERKKKAGYAPSARSGCSMTLWASKGMGVLFGGVFDDEESEEDMKSVFYNDLFAYNLASKRWSSLNIQKKKKRGGTAKRKKAVVQAAQTGDQHMRDSDSDEDADGSADGMDVDEPMNKLSVAEPMQVDELPPPPEDDGPVLPLTRYNAMIAILKNTLYLYGGIYETEAREYTLDDFYTLNLEKRDGYVTLRASGIDEEAWQGSDDGDSDGEDGSDAEEDESDSDEGDDEEVEEMIDAAEQDGDGDGHAALTAAEKAALREKASSFMGSLKETTRSPEEILTTPVPGETLRVFYERSREYWAQKAFARSGSRGKILRREGFLLCDERYGEYKPILQEIERIQKEAEVEAEDAKKTGGKASEGNRNRR